MNYKQMYEEMVRRLDLVHGYAARLKDKQIARNLRAIAYGQVKEIRDYPDISAIVKAKNEAELARAKQTLVR